MIGIYHLCVHAWVVAEDCHPGTSPNVNICLHWKLRMGNHSRVVPIHMGTERGTHIQLLTSRGRSRDADRPLQLPISGPLRYEVGRILLRFHFGIDERKGPGTARRLV